jgi:hypothetical protein
MIRKLFPMYGSPAPRAVVMGGQFTVDGSGVITAQTGAKLSGATVAKTGAELGRYSVTFQRTFKRLFAVTAIYVGADDAATPTTTGTAASIRLLTTSGFSIQAIRTDTNADADPVSCTYTWTALVATV